MLYDYAREPEAGWEFCLRCLARVEAADRAAEQKARAMRLELAGERGGNS